MFHEPVLSSEVIEFLSPQSNEHYIDCNLGGGGHAKKILEKTAPKGKLVGVDLDSQALLEAKKRLEEYSDRLVTVHESFGNIEQIVSSVSVTPISGILFDLGLSSFQIDSSGRGFSFKGNEPLDMRFSKKYETTALDIIKTYEVEDLIRLFKEYGELKNSKSLSENICLHRKRINTTHDLVSVAMEVMPRLYGGRENKYLSQVFQALRIEVNHELDELKRGLAGALDCVRPGGRIVVLSYHSLEDRIVKNMFREANKECTCPPKSPICICKTTKRVSLLTKKAVTASEDEVQKNPRSRSAKLRAVEKM